MISTVYLSAYEFLGNCYEWTAAHMLFAYLSSVVRTLVTRRDLYALSDGRDPLKETPCVRHTDERRDFKSYLSRM